MKNVLDVQLAYNAEARQKSRENDLIVGNEMIKNDLDQQVAEKQIHAYKRHELAKSLRETWAKQQIYKNNQQEVMSLFN